MGVKVKTIVKDRGWNAIEGEIKKANNSVTRVGIQSNSVNKEGEDLVTIAAGNEFGDPVNNIPERSFLRSTFDEQKQEAFRMLRAGYGEILDGKTNVRKVLSITGAYLESKTRSKVTDLQSPPNAPSTITRKGSSNPLIDTGQMRASIRHVEEIA